VSSCRPSIDADALRAMYVDDRLTIGAIAARLGCGPSSVGRRLHRLGIPTRPRGPARPGASRLSVADPPAWSADLAWLVGLIATDGNLGRTGRRLSISSMDVQLLDTARRCLGITNRVTPASGGWGRGGFRVQWCGGAFHRWLAGLGLTPRKSLTLGPLAVPDEFFADFFRGCIDGDGTVLVYTDRHHEGKNAAYVYRRLYVSLVSASEPFIAWIRRSILRLLALPGTVHERRVAGRRPIWVLRYSKKASIRLLRWMYYSPDVPCLERKRLKAQPFLAGRT
jgi:hypothetical protein